MTPENLVEINFSGVILKLPHKAVFELIGSYFWIQRYQFSRAGGHGGAGNGYDLRPPNHNHDQHSFSNSINRINSDLEADQDHPGIVEGLSRLLEPLIWWWGPNTKAPVMRTSSLRIVELSQMRSRTPTLRMTTLAQHSGRTPCLR